MIQKLNVQPQNAINAFNEARGHGMERQNYIDDLLSANWNDDVFIERLGNMNL